MGRALIDIAALDVRVQEQVAQHGNFKDFQLTLWRQDPDASGCNWDAHIERIRGECANELRLHDVVPKLRQRYNLK